MPEGFDEGKKHAAIVVAHPGGGVKEQTAGLYARKLAEVFLTQPLQIVAGSVAGSRWMSDDLYKRAASTTKNVHVAEGANHMSLYDVPKFVDEAVSVLAPFFKANLDLIAKVELAGMAR